MASYSMASMTDVIFLLLIFFMRKVRKPYKTTNCWRFCR